jgi:hypothetical protein
LNVKVSEEEFERRKSSWEEKVPVRPMSHLLRKFRESYEKR